MDFETSGSWLGVECELSTLACPGGIKFGTQKMPKEQSVCFSFPLWLVQVEANFVARHPKQIALNLATNEASLVRCNDATNKDPSLARRANVCSVFFRYCLTAIVIQLLGSSFACAAPDDVEAVKQDEQQVNVQFFQMDEANFDANVFQPSGNAKAARTQIETKLKLQLDELHRVCGITEAQKQKLTLAASSDVKRFFDEVDRIRKKVKAGNIDQNAWNNIWQEIQPLRNKQAAGLFGDSSFYAKTVRKTLNEEQIQKYDAVVNERRKFRYRASLEVAVTNLESAVPLKHSQHEAIVKLLMEETQPPPTFGQYDQYLVMHQLGKIAEPKLKPLLDEHQWKLMEGQIQQYKGMEQFLIQNGMIPKEDDEPQARVTVKKMVPALEQQADAEEPENQTREKPVPCPDT